MKNKMNGLRNWILACVIVLAAPAALLADYGTGIGEKFLSIGPRATYSTPKDASKGDWFAGGQVRLHLSPGLGLEGSVDYRRNDFGNNTTIKSYPVQASILAYILPGAVVSPFLLGGGGWYYTEVDIPGMDKQTSSRFGPHAGAGIEFIINEYLSLDGTYRYIWLEDITSKGNANVLDKKYNDSGSMVPIALNFLF